MSDFDDYSETLLEQSKRFLEKAIENKEDNDCTNAYLNASLLITISCLEAYINGICDDFSESEIFTLQEISFLTEKESIFERGQFVIKNRLKMTRLVEKIELLCVKFTNEPLDKSNGWWSPLNESIKLRNQIVHPKSQKYLEIKEVTLAIKSVIECIDYVFVKVYKKGLPSATLELQSSLDF